ncbi:MAG: 30S ribosomal protein S9 [uncultured bacterium]|nr:MAG: 30S ribosomal protein S9 [uncultured bacterium]
MSAVKDKIKKRASKGLKKAAYFNAVGRRKSAVARVKIYSGDGKVFINKKNAKEYFPMLSQQNFLYQPLKIVGLEDKLDVSAIVLGGGIRSQAEAVRLGVSRALLKYNKDYRKTLKAEGFLRRDPREKERKKYGLKGARRAPQFSKR